MRDIDDIPPLTFWDWVFNGILAVCIACAVVAMYAVWRAR